MNVSLDEVQSSISALVKQNKINSLIYSLIVPLIVGVYATFYSDLVKISYLLFWLPVILFVLFAIVTAYLTYDLKLAPEVYVEMDLAEQQIIDLEKTTRFLSVLQEQALVLAAMVREHVKNKTADGSHLREAIGEICSLLIENRDSLFDFQTSELWSFAVYVHCPSDNMLRSIWREKHRKHPSMSTGRDWAPGQGHVGIAWAQNEGKICPDIAVPGVWEMFSAPGTKREYDRSAYASFVSEPIGPFGTDTHPYGVLVATSNRSGRFDIASSLALRHAASAIAALVYLAYDQAALEALVEKDAKGLGSVL